MTHVNLSKEVDMTEDIRNAMEEKLLSDLEKLKSSGLDDKARETILKETRELASMVHEVDQLEADAFDRQEKRRIDEEKNANLSAIEREKMKVGWQKYLFEAFKILAPIGVSGWLYMRAQKRCLEFEENGRLTSTASRSLGLPRFFK